MTIWEYMFLFGAAWLGYVYVGYPLLLGAITCLRRRAPVTKAEYCPPVSVLIAARNEEKDIGWKIAETLHSDYPSDRIEVLVASDASEDTTDDIVRDFNDKRVRLVRMTARSGKGRALNALAPLAKGELLFFTDANAHVCSGAIRLLAQHFADERVGCVTGDSRSIQNKDTEMFSAGANVYWSYEKFIKYCEGLIGSVLVCDGAVFCIRKSLFSQLDPELANDLELPIRIGAGGYWVLHEPRAIVTENETTCTKQEYARRRRITGQGALGAWKLRPQLSGLRAWQFFSHKVLRWLSFVPMLLIFVSTVAMRHEVVYALLLCAQGCFYVAAMAAWTLTVRRGSAPKPLAVPFYIVLGISGCLAGVLDAVLGRKYDIWEIPTLSRGRTVTEQAARG